MPSPLTYQQQTHENPHWIVRWPHQRRLELAVREIEALRPTTFMDYGTGNAHLLELLAERGSLPPRTIAYEPVAEYADEARRTIASRGLADHVTVATTLDECFRLERSYDCIACLSVLEHMPLRQRELFYSVCDKALTGTGVVEVPVEIGPTILVKEAARRLLKGRNAEYTARDLVRTVFGLQGADPVRTDPSNSATWIQWHTGFDYRVFRDELAARFDIKRSYGSPMPHMPAPLGNQEFFAIFAPR